MKNKTSLQIAARALLCPAVAIFHFGELASGATFLISDVTQWVGPDLGPGISQAVLVIQWPSQPAWAWGYRWHTNQPKNGRDMLTAFEIASGGTFVVTGNAFISNITFQGNSFAPYNPVTGEYLQYFVNNAQQSGNFTNGAAPTGAHILPPLGSPYDGAGPGQWYASNTGVLGRPLVDGSWDGWRYSAFGGPAPDLAINGPAIPEPTTLSVVLLSGGLMCRLRCRRA